MSALERIESVPGTQEAASPLSALSVSEAARRAGVDRARLSMWLATGRIERPKMLVRDRRVIYLWTDGDIERIRLYQEGLRPGRT